MSIVLMPCLNLKCIFIDVFEYSNILLYRYLNLGETVGTLAMEKRKKINT